MQRKAWFLEGFVLVLTFVNCWLALTTIPPCEYGCKKAVGPANCSEVIQSAAEYHGNQNCLGIGQCHPAGDPKKQKLKSSHEILDACKASNGKTHIQHITTIEWDSDCDGRADTICHALHSCP